MKLKLKKTVVSFALISALSCCSLGVNAAEARLGGNASETFNGIKVEKGIDVSTTHAYGYTKCDSLSCSNVFVSVKGNISSTSCTTDFFSATRGKVEANVYTTSEHKYLSGDTEHKATINGSERTLHNMTVTL